MIKCGLQAVEYEGLLCSINREREWNRSLAMNAVSNNADQHTDIAARGLPESMRNVKLNI
jgi:hypothetical protein